MNNIRKIIEERLEMLEYALKLKQDATDSLNVANELLSNRVNVLNQENEKLKKAIGLLNLMFGFEVDVETETIYCCLGDVSVNGAGLIKDFELLKEVLGND